MTRRIQFTLALLLLLIIAIGFAPSLKSSAQQTELKLPSEQLKFGAFLANFDPGGTFSIAGQGWPPLKGTWRGTNNEIELSISGGPGGCDKPGRYRVRTEGKSIGFDLVADDCQVRRVILDRSTWTPATEVKPRPVRNIAVTSGPKRSLSHAKAKQPWPSFRGPQASGVADNQGIPDRWNGKDGTNVLWKTPIPGLAHSSPIVWGDKVFVTSAVSSDPKASFRPGLYGDGDASKDNSPHRWVIYAIDRKTGKIAWQQLSRQGEPLEKRHIKSTYANSTPATDGRVVVSWFGSQGLYAYDMKGHFLWKADLGRIDLGAYDIPTYEWGPASSPIIWNNLVIVQCDTQADSFLLALDAATGKIVWKTDREEIPSWGSPTVADTPTGPQLVTNASNYIRGYDPTNGKELWRLGGSSKITAPTPIFADGMFVVASGRGPERPIFVIRPTARGDVTLKDGNKASDVIVWSMTGRGSYMPTPLAYRGILYILNNNGLFDAYDLKTGKEIYRQRLPNVGSGFSASPIASDGKIYISNEDGEMFVIGAGENFSHISTNSMGELLMATPALSDGVMYVRSSSSLFAIGTKR